MKKQKLPTIVVIAILTLITAILWAFFDITRAFFKKPDIKVETEAISPLDPKLDLETLSLVQSAKFFEEGQVADIVRSVSPTPEPTPTTTPEAITEVPQEASGSGEVQGGITP